MQKSYVQTIIKKGFVLVLLGCAPLVAASQSSENGSSSKTLILPTISSSPETSLLFGGAAIFQFKMGNPTLDTRSSSVTLSGFYTLKNQLSFSFSPTLFLAGENWVLEGKYSYSYSPQSFWGVGPYTTDDDEMNMFYRNILVKQSLLKEFLPTFFVGPSFRWFKFYRLRYEDFEGNTISPPPITGSDDFYATGIGAILRWDERNSSSTPTEGHMINLSFMTNPAAYSSIDSYTTYTFDGRKYFDLWGEGSSIVAFQLRTDFTAGDPPFQDMVELGGASILRGYYDGRYVDRHGAQVQAEWRQHIYWRFGIAGFAAAGQVWPAFNEIPWEETRFSFGGGIRYNINKKDPTNIRVDYGIGEHSTGLYITIGEAF